MCYYTNMELKNFYVFLLPFDIKILWRYLMDIETTFPQYEIHPYAARLPEMSRIEFEALVKSIKEDGQAIPIIVYKNQILDGRHRYKACQYLKRTKPNLKILPKVEQYKGAGEEEDILRFVQNAALRRELTINQKAIVAASFLEEERKLAKLRQGKRTDIKTIDDEEREFQSSLDRLASRHRVNRSYISMAERIRNDAFDLVQPIYNGVISIPNAKMISVLKEDERKDVIALLTHDSDMMNRRENIGVPDGVMNKRSYHLVKYTVKQAIEIVKRQKTGYQPPNEPLIPSSPALIIFKSIKGENDNNFRTKMKQVAEILELGEEEIWYCAPRTAGEIKEVQKVSQSIHKKFNKHDRIVQDEILWPN